MKKTKFRTTVFILLAVLAVLLIWDIYVTAIGDDSGTISNVVLVAFHKYPFINSITFYVLGHLSWRMIPTKEIKEVYKKYGIKARGPGNE